MFLLGKVKLPCMDRVRDMGLSRCDRKLFSFAHRAANKVIKHPRIDLVCGKASCRNEFHISAYYHKEAHKIFRSASRADS